ncbi:DASS family sodium-coupled anion symporter [Fulvivirgaceae bacterium BMA12]|uniref:DASS family sodium-coupled anion symporter n=1 Tax=Agaribacillus aureus TaxID=3051825 RepID=A0ABT8LHP6_9BACT|nr:DASS family sodium-coupled anion symporter [Fulvivirgaceae bacterium BMA12]
MVKTLPTKPIKLVSLLLGPALFLVINLLPVPELLTPLAWKVISVAVWMITWWTTETVPLPVTALIPLLLFPLLGIFEIKEAAASYAHPVIFLFMGGFMIALGLEKRNLHLRIALNLIKITGTHPNGIVLGFMLSTAFISMWISNTATTVMMLPIAMSVIGLLKAEQERQAAKSFRRFALSLLLGIAYAANIGGAMTIIGTPPNVVSIAYVRDLLDIDLTFTSWLIIGFPVGSLLIAATFFLMTRVIYPSGLKSFEASEKLIHDKINTLGKISREEIAVAVVFAITALCWIMRQPLNNLIGTNVLNDTIIAMAGGVAMFILPVNIKKGEYLVDWESTKNLPWGILILFGGGICLARGLESSGLVQFIGELIAGQREINVWLLVLIFTTITLLMTEIMSNVALIVIFIPVVIAICQGFGYDPLLSVIPATLSASYAFMMPVSTPPNAIVFSSGYIKIREMMVIGVLLNIIAIATLMLTAYFLPGYF